MATVSFFVRQTSSGANASTLVVGNEASISIGFTNDNPNVPGVDTLGDLVLESTGGAIDPDTWVIIGGISYTFVYDVTGTLPVNAKVPVALQGKAVAVISASNGLKYFFVADGSGTPLLMNAINNGNIRLDGENLDPPPVHICFCAGTRIATPSGTRMVESLVAGDVVLTADGITRQVLWVGSTHISKADLLAHSNVRPILIPAHAFGAAGPTEDLLVSPQHRVVLDGPLVELMFAKDRVLVPAKHLVGTFAEVTQPVSDVTYFHVLLAEHELLISNGLVTESFQPAQRMIEALAPETRDQLLVTLAALDDSAMLTRKDAVMSLKAGEANALTQAMQAAMIAKVSRQTTSALLPA